MPYSPQHKRDTREKILESARRLFNRNGYSGVSLEEIMSECRPLPRRLLSSLQRQG